MVGKRQTAQEVMAAAIIQAGMCMGALAHYSAKTFEGKIVAFQMDALAEAGFEIRPLPAKEEGKHE